ncbi:MAG: purine-nucleoside phosphorylase [Sphingomonadales bacterium]
MSIHISARPGELAPLVLLPGDPLRAKFMANEFLTDARLVSETRNCLFYTGSYQNKQISIGSSGMGCPSIGIYSYELYTEYQVDTIIRIGTCGAYDPKLQLFDLINVKKAVSESTFALHAWGITESVIECQGDVYNTINTVASQKGWPLHCGAIHSSDVFYSNQQGFSPLAMQHNCLAVEMESFALFANAKHCRRNAACLLTVSDLIAAKQKISPAEREKALLPMMQLALETASQRLNQ